MYSAESSAESAAEYLLAHGADSAIRDRRGRTAFAVAADNGHSEVIQRFIERGAATINDNASGGVTALMMAARNGSLDSVTTLTKAGALVNSADNAGKTPLMYAAEYGNVQAATALVTAGADLALRDRSGLSAMAYARRNGHTAMISYLASVAAPE
jgi:ankyrin repeat protein